jgi:ribosomal protein L24E
MDGWHELAPGQQEHFHEIVGWDASARKYRSWYFGSSGERGEGWMTIDPDGKTFRVKSDGVDPSGAPKSGTGTMTLVSDKEIKWTWSESGPQGTLKLEGLNKKQ